MKFPIILSMGIQSTMQTVILEVPVISSKPIVRQEAKLVPKKICREINSPTHSPIRNDYRPQSSYNNLGGQVLGGLLGSMIGKSDSTRRLMTGVGVIVGDRLTQNNHNNYQHPPPINHTTHCYSSWSNQVVNVVKGYEVWYELDGKQFKTILQYQPGPTIKVNKKIVVDGIIDQSNPNIYTPQELVPKIIDDNGIEEEFIEPNNHPYHG